MMTFRMIFIYTILLLTGCVQVPRDGDFSAVKDLTADRIPQTIHWYQGGPEDEKIKSLLASLLQEPLTEQSVVQIALLNNKDLQAEYEKLGVAQADLVQAGLLSNPVLFSSIRFPEGGKGGNNIEFGVTKEFLDLLLRSSRVEIADTEFERVKLNVTNRVLELVKQVQSAFYRVQGARKLLQINEVAKETATATYELAQRYDEAGNISELRLAQERSAAAEIAVELLRTSLELQSARNDLNTLLGLDSPARDWSLATDLPELPSVDPLFADMEEMAIANRLDVAASQREINQIAYALEMTRDYRWIGGASVGVSTEREPDGARVTGPNFSIEIPIFDQRQAEIARLESLLAQSKSRMEALKNSIGNDVNSAINRVNAARKLSEYYRDELIPAREQVVRFTQQHQNYMLVDIFELLYVRQQQTQAYRGYIESLTDYWLARVDLDHAVGYGMPVIENSSLSYLDTVNH